MAALTLAPALEILISVALLVFTESNLLYLYLEYNCNFKGDTNMNTL